jgi:DNA-binding NtrC family response regulator
MVRLRERLAAFAGSEAPVLVLGESGTGKELAARLIHSRSARHGKPFVAINCAAFTETLIEAELFGHVRGAFTGAIRDRKGQLAAADGGTLFLDEIAELSPSAQAKLLRVLQEGTYTPVGSNTAVSVDIRLVSATHRDLKRAIAEGRFREDLFFRIKVLDVQVPSLAQRPGDIPLLVEHFLRRFTTAERDVPRLTPRAWAALVHHRFPGNVRELEHAIQYALVVSGGREIGVEHLPDDIRGDVTSDDTATAAAPLQLGTAVEFFEREYISRALSIAGGRKAKAAEMLGISRKHLWHKMRSYHM